MLMSLFTHEKPRETDENSAQIVLNDEGIIEISWVGDVHWKAYTNALQGVFQLSSELDIAGEEIKLLVDFSRVESIESRTPHIASRGLRDIPYKKIAGYGIKPKHQLLLDQIKEDARLNKGEIRDFATRSSALKWLKQ